LGNTSGVCMLPKLCVNQMKRALHNTPDADL